eukprot:g35072.t1
MDATALQEAVGLAIRALQNEIRQRWAKGAVHGTGPVLLAASFLSFRQVPRDAAAAHHSFLKPRSTGLSLPQSHKLSTLSPVESVKRGISEPSC